MSAEFSPERKPCSPHGSHSGLAPSTGEFASTSEHDAGPHEAANSPRLAPGPQAAAAVAAYLPAAPPAFLAQSDVLFCARGGAELPAHSQFLARTCQLFAELLDPGGGVQGRPTPAAPLRVSLQQHSPRDVAAALHAVYHPHLIEAQVAALQGPKEYGAQLDLAAFLRFGELLDALRAPLGCRNARMGEVVRFDFGAWLEVAERHNLPALRSYCLECLMHLLVAPGCTGRSDEPPLEQLGWEALSKADLLLVLDGLAAAVRRCSRATYEVRTRVPCTAAAAAAAAGGTAAAGSATEVAYQQYNPAYPASSPSWSSLLPPLTPRVPLSPATPRNTSPAGGGSLAGLAGTAQQGLSPGGATTPGTALPPSPRGDHLATVTVPKLRRADITAALPGEAGISSWQAMGELCRGTKSA